MTPQSILLHCGIHPSKIAKYVVKIEPPWPESLSKIQMLNLAAGLTTRGEKRKRTKRYHRRKTPPPD